MGLLRNRYSEMRRGLVGKTSETGQNGHNFWYDRWIALKYLHEFLEAVVLRVALDSLLDDEDVLSASLE